MSVFFQTKYERKRKSEGNCNFVNKLNFSFQRTKNPNFGN